MSDHKLPLMLVDDFRIIKATSLAGENALGRIRVIIVAMITANDSASRNLRSSPASTNRSASTGACPPLCVLFPSVAMVFACRPFSDTVPLYRLYASSVKQHHYTIDIHEYNTLNENNPAWVGEGIQYFVYSTDKAAGVYPAYRFYHSQLYLHHFTIDQNEMTQINAHPEWGYEYEGIGFYVFATASKI